MCARPLLLVIGLYAGIASAAEPSAAEPSAFEVASLCHLNRLRADPAQEGRLLSSLTAGHPELADVDLELFRAELAEFAPLPPLVFDPHAMTAARNHSAYMVRHGLGHGEEPDLPGFTGRNLAERLAHVGFAGKTVSENVFRAARSHVHGHLGFVVDWGEGGSGGMQPGRGHRVAMLRPRVNVVGIGAVAHSTGLHAVSHAFGIVPGRFLGAVAWCDHDANGRYDPGEGLPLSVALSSGETSSSDDSGLVILRLPGRAATEAILRCGSQERRVTVVAGILNAWIEWPIPAVEPPPAPAAGDGRAVRVSP